MIVAEVLSQTSVPDTEEIGGPRIMWTKAINHRLTHSSRQYGVPYSAKV